MWKNWNAERGISEEARSLKTYYSDGYERSLQGSHPGSFSLEFDAEPGIVSDRSSEVGTGRTTPIDWVLQALSIRDRLDGEKEKQDGGKQDPKPRTPSPDYENVEALGMKTIHELPDTIPDPDIPKVPMIKKYAGTYEMEKYKKNAMIIFNHKEFLGGNNPRVGTMQDEKALKTTFEMFNFEVESHLDLHKKTLLQELKKFCSKNFREYGCVCVAILTHGSKHGYLKAHDTRYSEHEIIECFDVRKNPSLLGKPIIMLIQACRGGEPATACNPGTPKLEEDVEMDNDDHYDLPTESNMVIFHSSYVGRASAREVLKGSWFIQTLCEQIKLLAAVEDFESICRAVRQEVALDKEHKMILNNKHIIAKQMPVLTSTLLRLLYLRKYEGDCEDEVDLKELFERKQLEKEQKVFKAVAKGAQEKRKALTAEVDSAEEKRKLYGKTICGCDVYFEYMKKCLRLFVNENPDDEVAVSILKIAGNVRVENGNKDVQADMVNLIRNFLSQNDDRFKHSEVVYFNQTRCCHHGYNRWIKLERCCCMQ